MSKKGVARSRDLLFTF